jgi:hypothetical protein
MEGRSTGAPPEHCFFLFKKKAGQKFSVRIRKDLKFYNVNTKQAMPVSNEYEGRYEGKKTETIHRSSLRKVINVSF